jgi:hypothetical protein
MGRVSGRLAPGDPGAHLGYPPFVHPRGRIGVDPDEIEEGGEADKAQQPGIGGAYLA